MMRFEDTFSAETLVLRRIENQEWGTEPWLYRPYSGPKAKDWHDADKRWAGAPDGQQGEQK